MNSFLKKIFSQTSFTLFVVIVVLTLAQIFWWIYFQVHQNSIVYDLHQTVLSVQSEQALDDVNRMYEQFLLKHTLHAGTRDSLAIADGDGKEMIPEALKNENYDLFYCMGEVVYYKNNQGHILRSVIDWKQLKSWFNTQYTEFALEKMPQNTGEVYRYGPARMLNLPVVIRPKAEFFNELTERSERKTLMFISEGMFLSVMVMLGIYLMYRTFKKDLQFQSQQNNFILSVTHELKSPLASIKLYGQTLLAKAVPPEKQKAFLEHALHDVDRLEGLIENVLEAARLEQSDWEYTLHPVSLSETLNSCYKKVQPHANGTIDWNISIAADLWAMANESALKSVFHNLIENAIKYSLDPKRISIKLYAQQNRATIEIEDNGIGIEKKDIQVIFEKFYRAGNEMTRASKGTGLGLYIVHQIIQRHKGAIEVQSGGQKKGAKFIIHLPLLSLQETT